MYQHNKFCCVDTITADSVKIIAVLMVKKHPLESSGTMVRGSAKEVLYFEGREGVPSSG